ncbi:hypothetical protein Tco_0859788, partial [Tanacetum coccineum]
GNAKELVSTARLEVSTARPDIDAARQEDSAMKEEKAKEKGVSIKDVDDSSRPERSILTLKPLLTIDPKDKGKSVLEEPKPAKKMTRSDFDVAQITRDAEITRQLQEDLQAEVERERQREEEATKGSAIAKTYDDVQAGIDVDALFAAKLQQEEREEYTIEERAKFLAEIIAAQRKFRAAQRSAKIRKIQGLYERQKRIIEDFKPMDSDVAVKDSKEAAGIHKQKVLEEPNKEEQLKAFLKIVPDDEREIDYEVLGMRFSTTTPEGIDLVLQGDLRIMFEEFTDGDIWKNQEKWIIKSWTFYGNCRVHTLELEDGTEIHMLAERSAPCYSNEALVIQEQTATGKEISNPFMAGEDCWVLEDFTTYCCWFNIGAASEDLVLLRKIEENRLSL